MYNENAVNFMKDFECAYETLLKVVVYNTPFNTAIQETLDNHNKNNQDPRLKSLLFAVCGCVLRHYYVFKEVISRQYHNISEENFLLIALGIGNKLFAKRIDQEKLEKFIAKKTGLQGAPMFIECFMDPKTLIPEDIQYGTAEYYALRYNIPFWVIRLWQQDGGELISRKLFYSVTNRPNNLVRINEDVIETNDFFEKYNDYTSLGTKEGIAAYLREDSPRKSRAVIQGDAMRIPLSYKKMCEYFLLTDKQDIAIYGCGTNHLLEELDTRLGHDFKAKYISGHAGHVLEIQDVIKQYGLSNVQLIEKDYAHLNECLDKPVDIFFVCPRSSFLLGLFDRADHFLRIKEEDIARLEREEYADLVAASQYVKKDGYLIYYVTTFCHKEGKKLIQKFLDNNSNYSLIKDKQIFPFDKYQSMLYFAVMKKEK